jgi:hypothetical protein
MIRSRDLLEAQTPIASEGHEDVGASGTPMDRTDAGWDLLKTAA